MGLQVKNINNITIVSNTEKHDHIFVVFDIISNSVAMITRNIDKLDEFNGSYYHYIYCFLYEGPYVIITETRRIRLKHLIKNLLSSFMDNDMPAYAIEPRPIPLDLPTYVDCKESFDFRDNTGREKYLFGKYVKRKFRN